MTRSVYIVMWTRVKQFLSEVFPTAYLTGYAVGPVAQRTFEDVHVIL
jgi:hypothetical protein